MHPSLVARHPMFGAPPGSALGAAAAAHHYSPGQMAAAAGLVACNGGSSPVSSTGCCPAPSLMYSTPGQYCAMQQQQQLSPPGTAGCESPMSYIGTAAGALQQMTTVGGAGAGGSSGTDDAWRGSSIAELRRKALEHTVSMGVAMTPDSIYR